MTKKLTAMLLAGTVFATALASSAPAEAQWRRYGHHGWHGYGPGAVVGGALLGLGVGALLTAPYYARPPVYYAPPAYYPAPYPYPPAYYYPPY